MRALKLVAAVLAAGAAAAPALAQVSPYRALEDAREADRVAVEQAQRQRDIAINNELSRLQTQIQTNQGLSDLATARVTPLVPTVPFNPNAPPPRIDPSQLAQIPDAALADSDAKVRAAAQNRK
jgi:hypothetical protein